LKEMEANNVQPNSFVFSRILANYRDRGEWQKSFQVLKEMESSGVLPESARIVLKEMEANNVQPNSLYLVGY
ncbi:hypothetical protein Q8G46_28310, partial [Klebsiella pneumoniae]|uniref:hypothetical protein n=1 Tax=Klebsiella pneumoniae TaxID=573 RepID=UPI0030134EFC